MARPPRISLVVPLESRFGATTGDPKLINAIAEKVEDGTHRVIKRQGTLLQQTVTGFGAFTATAALAAIETTNPTLPLYFFVGTNGGTNAVFASSGGGGPVNTGYVVPPGFSSPCSAAQVTLSPARVVFNVGLGNATVLVTDALGNNIAQPTVTSGGPGLVLGVIALDNTIYVMDANGNVYGSAPNDPTTWPGSNVAVANAEPGQGTYLAKHHDFAVAFKQWSTEFLYDAANATGSPLSLLTNATYLWGCTSGRTVQSFSDRLFWVAQEYKGMPFVAVLQNMQFAKISTPAIDKILATNTGNFRSFTYRDTWGHAYYGVTDTVAGFTLAYDIDQGLWYSWNTAALSYFSFNFMLATASQVLMLSTLTSNAANIYAFSGALGTDLGAAMQTDIYTPNHDFGTRQRKSLPRMDFISDQEAGPLFSRFSEDDFKTFSNFRSVDLNQKRPNLTMNGSFYRRAWNFRHNGPAPLRLEAVELPDLMLGS